MELLTDFDAADPVSGILRDIRIRSTVYCRSELRAPWGFGVDAHGGPSFHVVTTGRCWLELEGRAGQIPLAAGDLVVLPGGPRHWLRDDPATPATGLEQILRAAPPSHDRRLRYGGDGACTALVCGGFGLDGGDAHPILGALPALVHLQGTEPVVASTMALLSAEAGSQAPGAEELVNRLADVLLAQALRVALTELGAVRDRQLAAAIARVHGEPERAWTVGELAADVGLSRSAFAARFRLLVGESPKRYIVRTRLAHAAALLHDTDATLAEIAARAGYATEFSFSKAFKHHFGVAPGVYRRRPPLALAR